MLFKKKGTDLFFIGGTPDLVRAYCKEVIDTAANDGGYIVSAAVVMDGANPQNVRTMFDFTREYGVY